MKGIEDIPKHKCSRKTYSSGFVHHSIHLSMSVQEFVATA